MSKKRKYSLEFRQHALERLNTCSNISALARELGIRRKWLYEWRYQAKGEHPATDSAGGDADPRDQKIIGLQRRVGELEQLIGRQAAEIDFFKGALRKIKERRQSNCAAGDAASTTKSKA